MSGDSTQMDTISIFPERSIASEGITGDEFRDRIATVRTALETSRFAGLIAFGDCWRGANVTYFTEFRPLDGVSDIANAVFLLSVDADPVLLVSDQCLDYARSVTLFEVRSLRELTDAVRALAHRAHRGTVGLAGAAYIPATVLERIVAGLGDLSLERTPLLAEIKAIKSEAEVWLIRKAATLSDAAMAAINHRHRGDLQRCLLRRRWFGRRNDRSGRRVRGGPAGRSRGG